MTLFGLLRGSPNDEQRMTLDNWDIPWGVRLADGTTINETTAFNLSTVWACQTLISDAIATLPVDVFRKKADQRVTAESPPWIANPNPESTQVDFETQRMLSLLGWGNAYSLLIRAGGLQNDSTAPVVERWNLNPWRVTVRWQNNRRVYLYDGKELPRASIQHVPGYIQPGCLTGMSPIAHGNQSIGLGIAAETFGATLFRKGVLPAGVLQVPALPAETSKDVVDRLREQLIAANGGAVNNGKPMVLTGGATWNQTMVNPVDAQFLETRKFQVEEIARWFRVPPHMIGNTDPTTSWGTGIEQQSLGFVRYTLMTWLIRLEQADSRLINGGRFIKYNVDALVRADLKTRYEAHQIARLGGWASANDVRTMEDLPPIDNGDIYLQPLNYVEAGTDPNPAANGTNVPNMPANQSDPNANPNAGAA